MDAAPLLEAPVPFFARRSMAAAAWGDRLYCLGGVGANTATESILDVANDLWCFDAATLTWRPIEQASPWPPPRRCPGWVRHGEQLQLWGGSGIERIGHRTGHTFLNDHWTFDPAVERWQQVQASDDHRRPPAADAGTRARPGPRYTPVFQSVGGRVFLFGGYTEDVAGKRQLDDAWMLDGHAWTAVAASGREGYVDGDRPAPRYGCMHAADDRRIYICGGASANADHIDLWAFDIEHQRWALLAADGADDHRPAPRYCAAMTVFDQQVLLFGGRSRWKPKLNYNDLWSFDLSDRQWRQVHGNREPHRYDAQAAWPAYHAKSAAARTQDQWFILGGEGRRGHVSDFWRLDLRRPRWQLVQPARRDDPVLW